MGPLMDLLESSAHGSASGGSQSVVVGNDGRESPSSSPVSVRVKLAGVRLTGWKTATRRNSNGSICPDAVQNRSSRCTVKGKLTSHLLQTIAESLTSCLFLFFFWTFSPSTLFGQTQFWDQIRVHMVASSNAHHNQATTGPSSVWMRGRVPTWRVTSIFYESCADARRLMPLSMQEPGVLAATVQTPYVKGHIGDLVRRTVHRRRRSSSRDPGQAWFVPPQSEATNATPVTV